MVGTLVKCSEADITTTTRAHYGRWLLYYPVLVLRLKHLPPVTNCDITGSHWLSTGSMGHHGHTGSKSNYLQPSALQPIRLLDQRWSMRDMLRAARYAQGLQSGGPLCTGQARVCNSWTADCYYGTAKNFLHTPILLCVTTLCATLPLLYECCKIATTK